MDHAAVTMLSGLRRITLRSFADRTHGQAPVMEILALHALSSFREALYADISIINVYLYASYHENGIEGMSVS